MPKRAARAAPVVYSAPKYSESDDSDDNASDDGESELDDSDDEDVVVESDEESSDGDADSDLEDEPEEDEDEPGEEPDDESIANSDDDDDDLSDPDGDDSDPLVFMDNLCRESMSNAEGELHSVVGEGKARAYVQKGRDLYFLTRYFGRDAVGRIYNDFDIKSSPAVVTPLLKQLSDKCSQAADTLCARLSCVRPKVVDYITFTYAFLFKEENDNIHNAVGVLRNLLTLDVSDVNGARTLLRRGFEAVVGVFEAADAKGVFSAEDMLKYRADMAQRVEKRKASVLRNVVRFGPSLKPSVAPTPPNTKRYVIMHTTKSKTEEDTPLKARMVHFVPLSVHEYGDQDAILDEFYKSDDAGLVRYLKQYVRDCVFVPGGVSSVGAVRINMWFKAEVPRTTAALHMGGWYDLKADPCDVLNVAYNALDQAKAFKDLADDAARLLKNGISVAYTMTRKHDEHDAPNAPHASVTVGKRFHFRSMNNKTRTLEHDESKRKAFFETTLPNMYKMLMRNGVKVKMTVSGIAPKKAATANKRRRTA